MSRDALANSLSSDERIAKTKSVKNLLVSATPFDCAKARLSQRLSPARSRRERPLLPHMYAFEGCDGRDDTGLLAQEVAGGPRCRRQFSQRDERIAKRQNLSNPISRTLLAELAQIEDEIRQGMQELEGMLA